MTATVSLTKAEEGVAAPPDRQQEWFVAGVFTLTAFVGSALLFVVQPMVAKLLLPAYGGSATVWSTSSLFFQVLLLAAYWYAHHATTRLGQRWQPRLHILLLTIPLFALPLALPTATVAEANTSPVLWLLRTLTLMVGLPFVVLATTGPLLQRWYSWTAGARSHDPYFLYAASNLGSFGGLLAYPLVIEPNLDLAQQRMYWSVGFYSFAILCAFCALIATSVRRWAGQASAGDPASSPSVPTPPLGKRVAVWWTFLAFLPSSLMLGVTSHISTDVAPIPLLWVIPLAIYLATFVVAFGRTGRNWPTWAPQVAGALALVLLGLTVVSRPMPTLLILSVNLGLLAAVALAAHTRLAAERPAPENLTKFFLVIALGGALGGVFNGLLAPVLFDRVLEYQLALVAVPVIALGVPRQRGGWLGDYYRSNRARAALVGLVSAIVVVVLLHLLKGSVGGPVLGSVVILGVMFALGLWFFHLPGALIGLSTVLLIAGLSVDGSATIARDRTFYGSFRVLEHDGQHVLAHGTTVHGSQYLDAVRRGRPTSYYSEQGPLGDIFALAENAKWNDVGVVGLGAGTIAAYGTESQRMTFFEIDRGVVDIARDPDLFTYLRDARADVRISVGDGRLNVEGYERESLDLLVLDAFSSDAIPVHLLTMEAMEMYAEKLRPGGALVVHISNRIFDLEPVLASTSDRLGWSAMIARHEGGNEGATGSVWVALSPGREVSARLSASPTWTAVDSAHQITWTDDYSSVLSVMR